MSKENNAAMECLTSSRVKFVMDSAGRAMACRHSVKRSPMPTTSPRSGCTKSSSGNITLGQLAQSKKGGIK